LIIKIFCVFLLKLGQKLWIQRFMMDVIMLVHYDQKYNINETNTELTEQQNYIAAIVIMRKPGSKNGRLENFTSDFAICNLQFCKFATVFFIHLKLLFPVL